MERCNHLMRGKAAIGGRGVGALTVQEVGTGGVGRNASRKTDVGSQPRGRIRPMQSSCCWSRSGRGENSCFVFSRHCYHCFLLKKQMFPGENCLCNCEPM